MRLKPFLSLLSAIFLFFPPSGYALSSWECFGAGAAELFIPGLGYALTAQFDKTLIIGGSRWYTASEYRKASDADDYEEDPDAIYNTTEAEDSESDKTEISVYLNKSTWDANYYGSLYNNLLLTTWGDLYQYGCQPNTETYSLMAAPFRADHYYDNWMFWLPMAIAAANYHYFADYYKVDYYLERGLTERDLRRDSFPKYYMVGVGEEMFFRGTIQHQIFESLQSSFGMSADRSRHWSIIAASAIFAAAHTGAGFTANPLQAFLFGVYEGYVYHPSLEEFDLETAIAIHAWWDILIAYAILNNAKFHEDRKDVYNKNASQSKTDSTAVQSAVFPLISVAFRF